MLGNGKFELSTNDRISTKEEFLKSFYAPERQKKIENYPKKLETNEKNKKSENQRKTGIINQKMNPKLFDNIIGYDPYLLFASNPNKMNEQIGIEKAKSKGLQGSHDPFPESAQNPEKIENPENLKCDDAESDISKKQSEKYLNSIVKSLKINSKLSTNAFTSRKSTPKNSFGQFSNYRLKPDKFQSSKKKKNSARTEKDLQTYQIPELHTRNLTRSCATWIDPKIVETQEIFRRHSQSHSRSFKSNLLSFKSNSGVLVEENCSTRNQQYMALENLLEKYFKKTETEKGKEMQVDKARMLLEILKEGRGDAQAHLNPEPPQTKRERQQTALMRSLEKSRNSGSKLGSLALMLSNEKLRDPDRNAPNSIIEPLIINHRSASKTDSNENLSKLFYTPLKSQLSFDNDFNIFRTPLRLTGRKPGSGEKTLSSGKNAVSRNLTSQKKLDSLKKNDVSLGKRSSSIFRNTENQFFSRKVCDSGKKFVAPCFSKLGGRENKIILGGSSAKKILQIEKLNDLNFKNNNSGCNSKFCFKNCSKKNFEFSDNQEKDFSLQKLKIEEKSENLPFSFPIFKIKKKNSK